MDKIANMNYFELLAWLGIGSSHPGGFPATRKNLALLEIGENTKVLDAGCGSGVTACYLAKSTGCAITAVDLSEEMIEKAKQRAEREGVASLIQFKVADVNHLPFASNSFDLVLAESLSVFLNKKRVYHEFYRVLKPGGQLADLEMALVKDMPPEVKQGMKECFGESTEPLSFEEWVEELTRAGFEYGGIKNPQYLNPHSQQVMQELKKDWVLVKDLAKKLAEQPSLLGRLQKNANFIKRNYSYFGYGLLCGYKPKRRNWFSQFTEVIWPD